MPWLFERHPHARKQPLRSRHWRKTIPPRSQSPCPTDHDALTLPRRPTAAFGTSRQDDATIQVDVYCDSDPLTLHPDGRSSTTTDQLSRNNRTIAQACMIRRHHARLSRHRCYFFLAQHCCTSSAAAGTRIVAADAGWRCGSARAFVRRLAAVDRGALLFDLAGRGRFFVNGGRPGPRRPDKPRRVAPCGRPDR